MKKARMIFDKAEFPSCHASTIVEAAPGKFLAAWFGGSSEGRNDVRIWLARGDGETWSAPEMIAREMGVPCWNPVLFRSQAGTLFLWYRAGPNPMSWTTFLRRSTDQGQTWSEPQQYPAGLLGPIRAKPIQRRDGSILAGSSVESYRTWTSWVERSVDDGQTWKRFGPIEVPGHPYGLIQPTLYDTADGRVIALCRSRGLGAICRSESRDGGETWSPATPIALPNPNAGIDVVRIRSGKLILIFNNSRTSRSPLSLAQSSDDGENWKIFEDLETEPGEYSYPAIIQASDGRLHMTYTWRRTHIKHVVMDPPTD